MDVDYIQQINIGIGECYLICQCANVNSVTGRYRCCADVSVQRHTDVKNCPKKCLSSGKQNTTHRPHFVIFHVWLKHSHSFPIVTGKYDATLANRKVRQTRLVCPLVVGCNTAHKTLLLHVSRRCLHVLVCFTIKASLNK